MSADLTWIVILDLGDGREGDLDDLPIRYLNLDAGCREGLGGFHAANCSAHAPAVSRNNFHVVLAVKWLQSSERLRYFHSQRSSVSYLALYRHGSLPKPMDATGKLYLAYRKLSVYSSG